jgi:hypothetical protein
MPVLSKFYGVVVRMLFAPVLGAHFHAIYGEYELVVAIEPLCIIQGDAPARIRTMVLEWAAQHQEELLRAWRRCQVGLRPQAIAPLY